MLKEFEKRLLSSIFLIPTIFIIILEGKFIFYTLLIFIFLISSYEWLHITKRFIWRMIGILFLFFSLFSAFYFRNQNLEGFFLIILICIATDIGGYVFGKYFKGPKLIKISPNKTYSGIIGSYFFSLIVFIFFNFQFSFDFNFILISLLISTISQAGDLFISLLKRKANVKDTGSLLPGHGGILDRIDGIIVAIPIGINLIHLFK